MAMKVISTKHIVAKDFKDSFRIYDKKGTYLGEVYVENGVYKFWPTGEIRGYTATIMSEITDVIAHVSIPWEEDRGNYG